MLNLYLYLYIYIYIFDMLWAGCGLGNGPPPLSGWAAWRGSAMGYRHNGPCGPNKYKKY